MCQGRNRIPGLYLSVGCGVLVIQVPEDLPLHLSETRIARICRGSVTGQWGHISQNAWFFMEFPWISYHFMEFSWIADHFMEFPWISMNFLSFHGIFMNFVSFHVISMNFLSFRGTFMNFVSFHGISMNFLSFGISMNCRSFHGISMNFLHFMEFSWISYHFIEFPWISYHVMGFKLHTVEYHGDLMVVSWWYGGSYVMGDHQVTMGFKSLSHCRFWRLDDLAYPTLIFFPHP